MEIYVKVFRMLYTMSPGLRWTTNIEEYLLIILLFFPSHKCIVPLLQNQKYYKNKNTFYLNDPNNDNFFLMSIN